MSTVSHEDLAALAISSKADGPQLGLEMEDLNCTLLVWGEGKGVQPHVNQELDVVVVAIEGSGVITVDGQDHEMSPGKLLAIPKGGERSVRSTSERFAYLNVHKRRKRLMPNMSGRPRS